MKYVVRITRVESFTIDAESRKEAEGIAVSRLTEMDTPDERRRIVQHTSETLSQVSYKLNDQKGAS